MAPNDPLIGLVTRCSSQGFVGAKRLPETDLPIFGDSICILDPAIGYITSGTNDTLTSQPIEQEISHYLQYLSQLSNDSWSVFNVFSNDFSLIFSSTDEFTSWLIERTP